MYCYDAFDHVKKVGYNASGPTPNCQSTFQSSTTLQFDVGGRLHVIDDSISGTVTREYDDLDRLSSEQTPQGTIAYLYDNADRRTSMTVPGQSVTSYTYYGNNQLHNITQGTATVNLTYDNAARPATVTLPNNVIETATYDAASQLTNISCDRSGSNLGTLKYDYDADGRRADVWGTFGKDRSSLGHDFERHIQLANQLTSWNGVPFAYDSDGDLCRYGTNVTSCSTGTPTQTYTWNDRQQLTATSGGSTTYAYDGVGRRVSRTVGSTTTKFLYDGLNVVQEQDGGGGVVANEVAGLRVGNSSPNDSVSALGVDQTFYRKETAGTPRNLLVDALGSTIATYNGTGTLQASYTYEPYGKQTASIPGTETNPFQFTGREWDSGASLQFNRARYYDPNWGRFLSEDSQGTSLGTSLYLYGADRPTMFIDPLGLEPGGCSPSFFCDFIDFLSQDPGRILRDAISCGVTASEFALAAVPAEALAPPAAIAVVAVGCAAGISQAELIP